MIPLSNDDIDNSCSRCMFSKEKYCLCPWLPGSPCDTQTRIIVIQDLAELNPSKQKFSSIPILGLVLKNLEIHVVNVRRSFDLKMNYRDPSFAILYPSEASVPLPSIHSASETPGILHTQADNAALRPYIRTLVVIDGSWVSVQNIIAKNTCLQPHRCRHVRLNPANTYESAYEEFGLRTEPSHTFLSTAEAVAWALISLEGSQQEASGYILRAFAEFVKLRVGPQLSDGVSPCDEMPYRGHWDKRKKPTDECRSREMNPDSSRGDEGPALKHEAGGLLLASKGVTLKHAPTKAQKKKQKRAAESRKKRRNR